MDEELINFFTEYQNEYTKILPTKREHMYLYPYLDSLDHGVEGNKNKDTNLSLTIRNFFLFSCNKFIRINIIKKIETISKDVL